MLKKTKAKLLDSSKGNDPSKADTLSEVLKDIKKAHQDHHWQNLESKRTAYFQDFKVKKRHPKDSLGARGPTFHASKLSSVSYIHSSIKEKIQRDRKELYFTNRFRPQKQPKNAVLSKRRHSRGSLPRGSLVSTTREERQDLRRGSATSSLSVANRGGLGGLGGFGGSRMPRFQGGGERPIMKAESGLNGFFEGKGRSGVNSSNDLSEISSRAQNLIKKSQLGNRVSCFDRNFREPLLKTTITSSELAAPRNELSSSKKSQKDRERSFALKIKNLNLMEKFKATDRRRRQNGSNQVSSRSPGQSGFLTKVSIGQKPSVHPYHSEWFSFKAAAALDSSKASNSLFSASRAPGIRQQLQTSINSQNTSALEFGKIDFSMLESLNRNHKNGKNKSPLLLNCKKGPKIFASPKSEKTIIKAFPQSARVERTEYLDHDDRNHLIN